MPKIKIGDLSTVESLDESEQRAVRGSGFAAWLKNRSAESSEAEDRAGEDTEDDENLTTGAGETEPESPSGT